VRGGEGEGDFFVGFSVLCMKCEYGKYARWGGGARQSGRSPDLPDRLSPLAGQSGQDGNVKPWNG